MNDPLPKKSNLWMAAIVFASNFIFLLAAGVVSAAIVYFTPSITPIIPVILSYAALVFSTWYAVRYIDNRAKITEKNIIPVAVMAVAPVVASQVFAIGASLNRLAPGGLLAINLGVAVSNLVISFFVRDAVTVFSIFAFMRNAISKKD